MSVHSLVLRDLTVPLNRKEIIIAIWCLISICYFWFLFYPNPTTPGGFYHLLNTVLIISSLLFIIFVLIKDLAYRCLRGWLQSVLLQITVAVIAEFALEFTNAISFAEMLD